MCAVGLFSGGFWLLFGELVSHRDVFGCLLVNLAYLLSCLGCSLGGLMCSFSGPGWFLPGFGWLPLRLLKARAKRFLYSDVLLHIDDNRWTLSASLFHVAFTCACLVHFPASPAAELCCRAQQQMPLAERGAAAEYSSKAEQSRAEQSRVKQSTAEQSRVPQSAATEEINSML